MKMSDIIAGMAAIISLIAVYFTFRQNNNQKRQNTLILYEKWDSVEFSNYRAVAWDVWLDLKHGKCKEVVNWLSGNHTELTSEESEKLFSKDKRIAVRVLINYFVNVYEYHKLGLTDQTVTKELFLEPWYWWADFFRMLRIEVKQEVNSPSHQTDSAYNTRIQKTEYLDTMFHQSKEISKMSVLKKALKPFLSMNNRSRN
jgi:hypothetical protein